MAALTQRPQDRANALLADIATRAAAVVRQHAPDIGATQRERELDLQRALCATEALLMAGVVHTLCFEAHQLRAAAAPRLEADTFTVASRLDEQDVVLEYSAEWTEDHRGGNWLVCCQWVHMGGFRLDASAVGGPLKREVAARFQAECEAHLDRQPAHRRALGTVAVARAA